MNTRQEKMIRLADVARKYYIEDKKQSDIAKELGVSRPLISRMLTEAKALGLVEITIHDPWQRSAVFLEKALAKSASFPLHFPIHFRTFLIRLFFHKVPAFILLTRLRYPITNHAIV